VLGYGFVIFAGGIVIAFTLQFFAHISLLGPPASLERLRP
jgi:hypothetical protein